MGTTALPLRARGPGGGAPVSVPDLTTASTYTDLELALRIAFSISEDQPIVVLHGFPPLTLNLAEDAVLGSVLPPNEILTVREGTGGDATVLQGPGSMTKGKGKKSAAAGKRKAEPSSASPSPQIARSFGANVHTLSGPSSGRPKEAAFKRAVKRARADREKSDGTPEEDIAGLLLAAVGGGKGRVSQCMRAAFRKAVDKQYDEAKAEARIVAASSGNYVIDESSDVRRLADGQAARIKVTFHKGHGHRSSHIDEVDLLTKPQLLGTIGQVLADQDAREMLKPANMAGCSPRVFWSLVQHYGGNIETGLKQLFPTQDFAWLWERQRKLSEKALENRRQEEDAKREREQIALEKRQAREARLASKVSRQLGPGSPSSAAEVVLIDDDTQGGGAGAGAGGSQRDQRAQAALARLHAGTAEAPTVAVDEEDDGEVDCDIPEVAPDVWVRIIMRPPFHYKCALDLARADEDELASKLASVPLPKSATKPPTSDEVHEWISACQDQVFDDLMLHIVGGDNEVLDVLERVKIGHPTEIKMWANSPYTLINMIKDEVGADAFADLEDRVHPDAIKDEWRERAVEVLERHLWLKEWVSARPNEE